MTVNELIQDLIRLGTKGHGGLDVVDEMDNMISGVEYNDDGGDPVIVIISGR